jgi:hypothetical protein
VSRHEKENTSFGPNRSWGEGGGSIHMSFSDPDGRKGIDGFLEA